MCKSTIPTKRALGRGLSALIVNTETYHPDDTVPASQTSAASGMRLLPLDAIRPNPQQPRTIFDDAALQDLAVSIRTHGVIQPLIVTENPTQPGAYWLVAGERRWRAARLANVNEIPVLVREASPQQLMELALVENVQRADLSTLEEAAAYQTLMKEFGLTHQEIAERVGKSRSAVTNTLRLLELPLMVQDALASNHISAGHARALLALRNHVAIQQALQQVLAEELNVRQTEALVTQLLAPKTIPLPEKTPTKPAVSEQIAYLENRFRTAIGTRVQLNRHANGSGRLVVHFYNDDDLEQLYKLIGGHEELND